MNSILVIDDDPITLSSIIYLLKAHPYQAIGRTDGQNGVEVARKLKPDLILCDVVMPGMNGYEVLEVLRQDSETAHIPVIFLTAKTAKRDVLEGIDLGAAQYLSKPIEHDELLAAVASRFMDLERDLTDPSPHHSEGGLHSIPSHFVEEYEGWWLAIEPDSQRAFLGKTRELAYSFALRAYPSSIFLYRRLGENPNPDPSEIPTEVAVDFNKRFKLQPSEAELQSQVTAG